jgi:hypothetical protein
MNEFQQLGVGQQAGQQFQPELAPQGFFGSMLGAPLGGLIGRGIGGMLGNAQLGSQIGQAAGGIGSGFLPLSADPYQQLQQQQQLQQLQQGQGQLSPQGWFGNAISQFGRPLGGLIGGIAGNQQLGSTIGGIASQLGGMLPFSAGPQQQFQQHPHVQARVQQLQQLQQIQQQIQQQLQQLFQQQQQQPQPSQQQPHTMQQAGQGQGQMTPQGWFGNALSQFGQPVGSFIGGLAGNQQLGNTIGGIASQLGGMLPFSVDPYQMQQLAQQLAQQQAQQQALQGQQGQQGQLTPQGWFGNAISQFGRPLGGFIGGIAGNQQLGSTIGGIASQLGGMLPFSVDPYQLQQLAQQQQGQQLQPGQYPVYTTPPAQGNTVH